MTSPTELVGNAFGSLVAQLSLLTGNDNWCSGLLQKLASAILQKLASAIRRYFFAMNQDQGPSRIPFPAARNFAAPSTWGTRDGKIHPCRIYHSLNSLDG
jgi:hypothetical protein